MKRPRKCDFPCLDCGPTKWMLTMAGYICSSCHGDAADSDPTEECSMCHGHVWKPAPFTRSSIIGPGSTAGRCWRCEGTGRVKKASVRQAEFEANMTPEMRASFAEIREKYRGKKLKLGE